MWTICTFGVTLPAHDKALTTNYESGRVGVFSVWHTPTYDAVLGYLQCMCATTWRIRVYNKAMVCCPCCVGVTALRSECDGPDLSVCASVCLSLHLSVRLSVHLSHWVWWVSASYSHVAVCLCHYRLTWCYLCSLVNDGSKHVQWSRSWCS